MSQPRKDQEENEHIYKNNPNYIGYSRYMV
jgi:hypothetical protein